MRRTRRLLGMLAAMSLLAMPGQADELAVRGLHVFAPRKGAEVDLCERFIREALPKERVNVLVLEFGYSFQFRSRPELADGGAMGRDDVRRLAQACRAVGVKLIPELDCLGHQSWAANNGTLLRKYPQFDETPGVPANNKGIYCRSYCPLAPGVHEVVFALLDELAEACQADAVHCGMDEVFLIADKDCPRCRGKDPAELFAGEVKALHDHLKSLNRTMWMWGDRFLDGKATGIGEWDASVIGTHRAIDLVPKDIVICDWHYDKAWPTPEFFARKGFRVVASPWRKPDVALDQLKMIRALRSDRDPRVSADGFGMLQTTWVDFARFARAYFGEDKHPSKETSESVACFRALSAALRGE